MLSGGDVDLEVVWSCLLEVVGVLNAIYNGLVFVLERLDAFVELLELFGEVQTIFQTADRHLRTPDRRNHFLLHRVNNSIMNYAGIK
jgi:hypothetical protein